MGFILGPRYCGSSARRCALLRWVRRVDSSEKDAFTAHQSADVTGLLASISSVENTGAISGTELTSLGRGGNLRIGRRE
jgi:hypothetical protein